jgi:hypothetical protein
MLVRMPPNIQMVLKLAIVGLAVVGVFVVTAMGVLDAKSAMTDLVMLVTGLAVALGISGGLTSGAAQLVRGQTPETGPTVIVNPSPSLAPVTSSPKAMFPPSGRPPANERGFVHLRSLAAVLGLGVILVGATGATCTPGQAVADLSIGLNAAICVLNTISANEAKGMPEGAAIENAAATCFVTTAQATGVLAAHRKALVLEGYAKSPAPAAKSPIGSF